LAPHRGTGASLCGRGCGATRMDGVAMD
jgi:hypothetical protein